jgi:hypothetical protein
MNLLLAITGVIETATGLALLVLPAAVVRLLLGSPLESSAEIVIARVAGAALLALGVACWLGRNDTHGAAARGLVAAMLLYNVGAVVILGAAGVNGQNVGIALWPAVLLHAAMTVWCVAGIFGSN